MEQNLKVVKRVNKAKTYVDEKGKERLSVNYYLVVNGNYIAIRPSFHKGYYQLDTIAETVING